MTDQRIPPPPPGFVMSGGASVPPPPAGFVMEGAQQPDDGGFLGQARTALGGFLEGIPVAGPAIRGGIERAAAATMAPFVDETYGDLMSRIGQMNQQEKAANPVTDAASQVAGAVAGTVPMVAAAPGAFGLGAGNLATRSLLSSASGGAIGAADAGVRSGGDPGAVQEGATWGAGLGAVAPGAGALAGKAAGALAQRFRGPSGAERAIGRAAGADAVPADDIAARLGSMGDDAMVMDLGPNLQRQAGALAATPGRAQEVVRSAIAGRGQQAGERVSDAASRALGQPVDTMAVAEDIITRRAATAKPLYDAAYSKPVPFTQELETLLKRPTMGKALKKAQTLAADEGIASRQWFANVADDGTVAMQNVPDVRQLDLTKRALDDMISTAQRAGNNNEARIFTQMKNQLVGMIDEAVPEYAQARSAFSGPAAVLDAMEEGQKAFSNKVTPSELRTRLMKMGEGEKEAFIQGARAQVADIMGTARNDALAARSVFDKGYNREKLALLIGPENADEMIRSLDAEAAFTRTRDVVTGNSETAARAAAMQEVQGATGGQGVVRSALNMRFGDAAAGVGDRVIGAARAAKQGRANEELARMLTAGSRDPQTVTQAIRAVQAAAERGQIADEQARRLVRALMQSGAQERSTGSPAPALMPAR